MRACRFVAALLDTAGLRVWVVLELRGLLCLFAAGMQVGQTLDPGSKGPLVSGALCRHNVSALRGREGRARECVESTCYVCSCHVQSAGSVSEAVMGLANGQSSLKGYRLPLLICPGQGGP